MEPFSMGLAVAGASALVTAMVTDGWEGVRRKIGALFGRDNEERTEDTLRQLDRTRAELAALSGDELATARQRLATAWQTRLEDLLDKYPDAQGELRRIVTEINVGNPAAIQQHVQAHDQAQVAVQGQGVQHVSFGDNKPRG
jgi:hypothetical protein